MGKHAARGGRTHASKKCWNWQKGDRVRKAKEINCPFCLVALKSVHR